MTFEEAIARSMKKLRVAELSAEVEKQEPRLPKEKRPAKSYIIKVRRKRGKPCVDKDGKKYPSRQAFADAHGITVMTVIRHLNLYGNLNNIGEIKRGYAPEPITIRGVEYPSIQEASEKLGVGTMTIYSARKRGTLDKVGLGPGGYRPRRKNVETDMALSSADKTISNSPNPLTFIHP